MHVSMYECIAMQVCTVCMYVDMKVPVGMYECINILVCMYVSMSLGISRLLQTSERRYTDKENERFRCSTILLQLTHNMIYNCTYTYVCIIVHPSYV